MVHVRNNNLLMYFGAYGARTKNDDEDENNIKT